MIKSPCCPDSAIENLAFTLYAVDMESSQDALDTLLEEISYRDGTPTDEEWETICYLCRTLHINPSDLFY